MNNLSLLAWTQSISDRNFLSADPDILHSNDSQLVASGSNSMYYLKSQATTGPNSPTHTLSADHLGHECLDGYLCQCNDIQTTCVILLLNVCTADFLGLIHQ